MSHDPCPPMPEPVAEHKKLLESVGTWDVKTKSFMEPGKPPLEGVAVSQVSAVGGFWTMTRFESAFMGQTFIGYCQMGYSPEKSRYTMTWIDSMSSFMFAMEGVFDRAGTTLTLFGKGPSMTGPELADWKSVMTFAGKDSQGLKMYCGDFIILDHSYTRRK